VKIDIEGSEQQLLERSAEWLESADAIIIEFHPTVVDCRRLVDLLKAQGFRYIPADSIFPGNMDCFVRTTV
jgi:hypothetical protein